MPAIPAVSVRAALRTPPPPGRSRFVHWLAWALAVVALAVLLVGMFAQPTPQALSQLAYADVVLTVIFALEFLTRSGLRTHRGRYLRWRWFDFVAMVPAVYGVGGTWPAFVVWLVLACRVIRAVDRTLGDGFVQRQVLVLVSAIEEEITDRVADRVLARWQAELATSSFGQIAATALMQNKQPILKRIYAQQLHTGTMGKLVEWFGLRGNIEHEESLVFDEIVAIVGSAEVDKAIRDVMASSFATVRSELGERTWKSKLGKAPEARISR
jgi:hypothetical protein